MKKSFVSYTCDVCGKELVLDSVSDSPVSSGWFLLDSFDMVFPSVVGDSDDSVSVVDQHFCSSDCFLYFINSFLKNDVVKDGVVKDDDVKEVDPFVVNTVKKKGVFNFFKK